ncbi:MAG TPA: RDD family protein [Puia sp.]|nr:RDD family protein [Puia sp.]
MEANILDDIEYRYQQPSASVRFCNFLVDRGVLYGLWRLLLNYFGYPIGVFVYSIAGTEKWAIFLVSYALAVSFHLVYYTVFEAATGGKTLGKFITRTRAVNADGTRLTIQTALLRNLCRLIPFEPFSAFGKPSYPWHDSLSKTLVVDETLSQLPPWD